MSKLRVGIDVGGTFTHAVAVDNESLDILGYEVTPTSHGAAEGVARGVVTVFMKLLESIREKGGGAEDIIFVAHSTTQATNALLEGDVSPVGIVSVGSGVEGLKAKMDSEIPDIEIAKGKILKTYFSFLDTGNDWEKELLGVIQKLIGRGARCIVAAEAFSVDDPRKEEKIKEAAEKCNVPACGTFEMSGLYGLRVRTRTAVINASILPKMMDTAEMTESSLKVAHILAPLMIMRSDGGVMSLQEMKRRPLMTLLSGPAAGIAAALTYIRATDAVFLEVGGTSTDISVIKNGKAMIRSAQVGGHLTYMKTLDSRTLGIAGGSLIQTDGRRIVEIGPRSAHIAGLPYVSYTDSSELEGRLKVITIRPLAGDPDYLAIENETGKSFALTTTCAANFLGFIKEGDYSYGQATSIKRAFEAAAEYLGGSAPEVASGVLEKASEKIIPTIKTLVKEYELAEKNIRFIGGGGGASAIVPHLSEKMGVDYEIARNAPVISAIGAALAMVRETIERNVFDPKPQDLENIKREAEKSVLRMGASPESIEVHIEVDGQKNIVRAVATGSIEFRSQDLRTQDITEEQKKAIIAKRFDVQSTDVTFKDRTDHLSIFEVIRTEKRLFNLIRTKKRIITVIDGKGTMKLQVPGGNLVASGKEHASATLRKTLEENRIYGDAGASVPAVFIVYGTRVMDLSSVAEENQILSLAHAEFEKVGKDDRIVIIVKSNG